ncbi:MAG TPA: NFACT RNA binding domain-containing protein [Polyangiaceae bacterium]|nr:NFACT RNA binding domain-containing protein [Polyangiaceae bacterium]
MAERDALRERGTDIAEALLRADVGDRRDALRRALTKALARIGRRVEAVQRDLTKIGEAQETARRAQLFVVEAARAPRGARELQAVDWSSGAAVAVRWPLDPAKTAQSQIEVAFHRARRMKAAGRLVAERLRAAIVAQETLSGIAAELERPPFAPVAVSETAAGGERASAPTASAEHAPGPGALAEDDALAPASWTELESRARAAAPLDFKLISTAGSGSLRDATPARPGPKAGADGVLRLPYRTFVGPSKRPILVGRSAEQNDALTLRVARPHDLWLHAKGWTGAHVVVPLEKGATCPADTLVEAAHLAAHFSDARGESVVEVTYTPRRYVRKPRGSAPGLVVVDREKVIVLRSRADTLRELLACET